MGRINKIRKADGSLTAFDEKEIVKLIYQATVSAGAPDYEFAEELSDIVVFFLERTFTDTYPTFEEISEWIERVLLETADPEITRAFILWRDEQKKQDNSNQKTFKEPSLFEEFEIKVTNSENVLSFWNRNKITDSLRLETGISNNVADDIAVKVESKIFSLGHTKVTTSLVRALVDTELIELGLFDTLKDYEPAILPFVDFENILMRGRLSDNKPPLQYPSDLTAHIAKTFYKQYSAKKIYSPSVIEAVQNGQIYPSTIENPFKLQKISFTIEGLKEGIPDVSMNLSTSNIDKFVAELSNYIQILFEFAEEIELQGLTWGIAPMFDGLTPDMVQACWQRILLMLSKFKDKKLLVEINYKTPALIEKLPAKNLNKESFSPSKTISDFNETIQRLANQTFDAMLKNQIPRNSVVYIFTFSWEDIFKPLNYKILEKACICASEFANPVFRLESEKIKGMLASSAKSLKGIFGSVSVNLTQASFNSNFDEDIFTEVIEMYIGKAVQALKEQRSNLLNYFNRFQHASVKDNNNPFSLKLEDFEGEIKLCGLTSAIMFLYNEKNRWGLNKIRKRLSDRTQSLFDEPPIVANHLSKSAVKFLSYLVFRLKEEQAKLNFKISITSEKDSKISADFWALDSQNYPGEIEFFAYNDLLQSYPLGFKVIDHKLDEKQKLSEEARISSILDGKNISVVSRVPKFSPDEILNLFKLVFSVKGASELAFSTPAYLCLSCGHLNNFDPNCEVICQRCKSSIMQQGEIRMGDFFPKEIKHSDENKTPDSGDTEIEIISS